MSARTPFNPTRPAAAGPTAGEANTAKTNAGQFQADLSNPLHSDPAAQSNPTLKSKSSRPSLGSAPAPAPLNVQNLKNKKRPQTPNSANKHALQNPAHQNSTRRQSNDQAPPRPATADASLKTVNNHRLVNREHHNALGIAAPSPRAAPPNTPGHGLQSNGPAIAFKHPGLPASAVSHDPMHDLSQEDTHIPRPSSRLQSAQYQGYGPATGPDEDGMLPPPRNSSYHRGRPSDGTLDLRSPPLQDEVDPQVAMLRASARVKRNRIDVDDMASQGEYPVNTKRYKGNQMCPEGYDEDYARPIDGLSSPRSHHSDYQGSPGLGRQPSAHRSPSAQYSRSRSRHAQQPYPPPAPPVSSVPALDALLGRDTNAYMEANAATYDRLVKKWSDCTVEEWKAGANDLTQKYGRLLEVAQKHMMTKLNLFATFDQKVDQHNKVLDNRSMVLAGAKERVIKDSKSLF